MSAKPFTAGHDGLVRLAARECDEVHLFVSLSNRFRTGEPLVMGTDMQKLWQQYIEKSLPNNVVVTYGGSPVANVFKAMDAANKSGAQDTLVIYSDPEDASANFPEHILQKYGGELYGKGQLEVRPVKRTETVDVSGTKVRQALATGDKKAFLSMLPKALQRDDVWDILYNTSQHPPADVKHTDLKSKKKKPAPPTTEAALRLLVQLLLRG